MKRWFKWLLVPAVIVAALLFASPRSAEAQRFVIRGYYPRYAPSYVYRYPRHAYYYAPSPVVVYRPPAYPYFYAPPVMPYPMGCGCW